ncbi:MAG: SPFH domain-containing protein [Chitinophagales bacterium]
MTKRPHFTIYVCLAACVLQFWACTRYSSTANRDHVFQTTLKDVRLGDGVPINLVLSIRWKIDDASLFYDQFNSLGAYDSLMLIPRGRELAGKLSNTYSSVDSVFTTQREPYIRDLKQRLLGGLGEDGVEIKEIIVSDIYFPKTFTDAMEQIGLRERELEQIRLKNILDLEQAEAKRKKAKAEGTVTIEEAKVEGEVAEINAQIERKKRLTKLAEAETEAQVIEKKALAEARRIQVLADAELEKRRDLNNLDVDQKRNLLTVDKDNQVNLAGLYQTNPVFASFLVNKELASKIQIAVVPPNTDISTLSGLIQTDLQQTATGPVYNLDIENQKRNLENQNEDEEDY